jgi:hypothetical protein
VSWGFGEKAKTGWNARALCDIGDGIIGMKQVLGIAIIVALAVVLVVQQRQVATLQAQKAKLIAEAADARQAAQRVAETPKADTQESERIAQERSELAKLRAEVSALRKEKAEWEKNRGAAEAAALAASQIKPAAATTPAAQEMQWVETIMSGPSLMKGTEVGNIRRKMLNGEPLNEAERALLMNMNSKTAEIEKSPEEFATFQSAFIASLLGWNNDPRLESIKGVLTAAVSAANSRGFDFHAPAENSEKWDDNQKALNKRATSAVQNVLLPEERAVFDKAFIGVLGVDTGQK